MKLTQERLKELFHYDPDTGIFTRIVDKGRKSQVGVIAGYLDKVKGYWQIKVDCKKYLAHRLVFLYVDGYMPENDVDHIDRDRNNNRKNNLREASRSCNARNSNISSRNKSGITGVCWNKKANKWAVKIQTHKPIHLGYFDNLIDAAKARWKAEVKYNFPNCNSTSSAYVYLKEKGVKIETLEK